MEELKQQIEHLVKKFGFEAVEQELAKHNPIKPFSGGDNDNDADDGMGGIQDGPNDI